MALDTRDKRASAVNVSCPWRGLFPVGDGTVSQGDRQQTAFMFAGLLAGDAAANPYPPRRWRIAAIARRNRRRKR